MLLKLGAKFGLNLAQIGQILCRPDDREDELSTLEQLVQQTEERLLVSTQLNDVLKRSKRFYSDEFSNSDRPTLTLPDIKESLNHSSYLSLGGESSYSSCVVDESLRGGPWDKQFFCLLEDSLSSCIKSLIKMN